MGIGRWQPLVEVTALTRWLNTATQVKTTRSVDEMGCWAIFLVKADLEPVYEVNGTPESGMDGM